MREPASYDTQMDLGTLGDRNVRLWYYYIPARPGYFSGPPDNWYPDDPAEIELIKFELIWKGKAYELPLDLLDEEDIAEYEQAIIRHEEEARAEAIMEAQYLKYDYD